jgi:hypothetical protein
MSKHSRWSPSKAHRWMACPASVAEEARAPTLPPSPYAKAGVSVAKVAEQCLRDGTDPLEWVDREVSGELFTAEDVEPLRLYVEHVRNQGGTDAVIVAEAQVDAGVLWPGLYGTADAVVVDPPTLYISDLKWGEGVFVSAVDNPQLMIYGLAALLTYQAAESIERVIMSIVQPRWANGPAVRTVAITAQALLGWGVQVLLPALRATEARPAHYRPGEHCRWCAARATCPALREHALELARAEFNVVDATTLGNDELAQVLDRASLAEAWIEAVRVEALARVQRGEDIPGYILGTGRSRREWAYEEPTIADVLQLQFELAREQIYVTELRSPAQIEKLVPKKRRDELGENIKVVPGGAKLVKDDGRVPLAPRVREAFTPTFLA